MKFKFDAYRGICASTFSASMFFVVLLLATVPAAIAQTTQTGTVAGTVTTLDHQPAVATITLSNTDGYSRLTSTSADGTFVIRNLPSGSYIVEARAQGLESVTQPSVSVAVGRTTQLVFALPIAGAKTSVNVVAAQTSFDPNETSSVVNIDRDRVEELPIPSRNYLNFVLLSPQVAAANPALSQGTASQGAGGFSFGGLRPGSNSIVLDGTDDDDEYSGDSRTQLSPEAINDFQIVNHGFNAESGGAAGGSIDVQTRIGNNHPHGDAFIFVQNGALNGPPPLGIYPRKPDESRVRVGISEGGVLIRDRTYYYFAAEQELARGEDVNDLAPATMAVVNSALASHGAATSTALHSGFFPTTDQETELSTRLDQRLTEKHQLMLRYAFTNSRSVNDAFNTDDLVDLSAHGSSFISDNSLNGTLTSTLHSSLLNTLNFELSQRRAVERTQNTSNSGILIPGLVLFGTPYRGNTRRFETHIDFNDHLLIEHGHHLIQIGAGLNQIALRAELSDGFRGLFVFPSLAALTANMPDFFTQSFGNPDTNFSESRASAYLQDHYTPSPHLAFDIGLRYDLNALPSPLPTHALNLAPRFGLAWTPLKSLVVRSGFGLFYDRYQLSTINRLLDLNGTQAFSQIMEGPAAAAIYQAAVPLTQPLANVAPSIWRAQPNLTNPYSEVGSLSIEQSLPLQTTLTAEYQYVHGLKLGRTINANLAPPVLLTPQNAATLGFTSPTPQQLNRLVFTPARLDPHYDAINQFSTEADSTYNAFTITANRQFQDNLELLAGYTYSKTIDDASSDLEQPQNPYNLRAERSLSLEDQRHRFTLSGLYLIGPDPDDILDPNTPPHPGALMRLATGLEFAPILTITSGFHANPLTGLDSSHEHIYPFATRPEGYSRNSLTTAPNYNFDLRILRIVPTGLGHLDIVAESFNLLNHPNPALLNNVFGSSLQAQQSFARPIETSTARRIQFSLDFEF